MNLKHKVLMFVESNFFRRFILIVILINAVVLGLETSKSSMALFGFYLQTLDCLALAIFIIEIILKIYAYGLRYFREPWNVFDFCVVTVALLPVGEGVTVLRAMRILRVFRLISIVPKMRPVVQAFIKAIPGMGSIMVLMTLVFYVFAVMATNFFGDDFEAWFGSVGASLYSLFQIMTLESWSMGIVRPMMQKSPLAWAFFIPFILITTFTVLNLFVAIIVNCMHEVHDEVKENTATQNDEILKKIQELKDEMALLREESAHK